MTGKHKNSILIIILSNIFLKNVNVCSDIFTHASVSQRQDLAFLQDEYRQIMSEFQAEPSLLMERLQKCHMEVRFFSYFFISKLFILLYFNIVILFK